MLEESRGSSSTTRPSRDEAEELYGDYVDAVETGTELLADLRDHYAQTLDDPEPYLREFNRAVAKRLPEVRARDRESVAMLERIEDYGIVGDLQTAALVGRTGSVDWLCFPRFDSGVVLRRAARHARPRPLADRARRGRAGTCVATATTRSSSRASCTHDGSVRVIDPCRRAKRIPTSSASSRGSRAASRCAPSSTIRFDYGSVIPWVRRLDDETLLALGGPDALPSARPSTSSGEDMSHVARLHRARRRTRPVRR